MPGIPKVIIVQNNDHLLVSLSFLPYLGVIKLFMSVHVLVKLRDKYFLPKFRYNFPINQI
jgi:hypothetical protein